jgi:hypothetical protein
MKNEKEPYQIFRETVAEAAFNCRSKLSGISDQKDNDPRLKEIESSDNDGYSDIYEDYYRIIDYYQDRKEESMDQFKDIVREEARKLYGADSKSIADEAIAEADILPDD